MTKEKFRSEVDNIGYWVEAARLGIVPYNPSIPVKPGQPIRSRSGAGPIDQMSTDIQVWDETNVHQSENSVAIEPGEPETVLNSNNSGETTVGFYGTNYINSYNAGSYWTGSKEGAGGANKGDPAATINDEGRKFIGFITSGRGQGIAYSDNGTTWTSVNIDGPYGIYDLMDKNHLTVDPRSSGTYHGYVYSAWTHFEYGNTNDEEIMFSRSTNSGVSWSTPINISSGVNALKHNQGVNLQTGPSGQVYAVWAVYDDWTAGNYGEDAIAFARSTNGGSSFTTATRIHDDILGIRSDPNDLTNNATGKNQRVSSFPSMAVDISGGPHNGNIYIVWANIGIPGTNTGTNVSIYMMRSTNGGISWWTPVRVNQGSTADGYASYFPWITCDPVTGKLYCIFYDDRNLGSSSTDVETWVAYSEDGGVTWDDFRVSDVSFTPSPIPDMAGGYMGDYLGIDAEDNYVYPTWTDSRDGTAQTYVSPLRFTDECIATGGCDEYISNVTIDDINNSSLCEQYSNYTDLSTDVMKGSSYSLSVSIGNFYPGDDVQAWVDWNRDGDFLDSNEDLGYATGPGPHVFPVNVPEGILSGKCTLRVRLSYSGTPPLSPCGSTSYGEVEDYTLNVYEYCVASGGCDEYISNVQIGTINNSSGCDGYMDYSYLSTNLNYESTATVTVTNGVTNYSSDQCGVWVDWNRDKDFLDANEYIPVTGSPGVGPYTATIDPPEDVLPGPYTMRIRITYSGTLSSCGNTTYGEVEDYTINITGHNTWTGTFNHYWHNANNWSAGHIPLDNEDVIINNVGYQPVRIDDYPSVPNEVCRDLTVGEGATLNFYNMKLVVNEDLSVFGEIGMLEDDAIMDVLGNAVWQSGSTVNVTAYNTFFNVWGNWNFESGANFSPTNGFVDFEGTTSNWIRCYSGACNFYNLRIQKSGGGEAKFSNISTNDLVVNNLTFISSGGSFKSLSNENIVMKGPFNYYGTFDFTEFGNTGSVVFDGATQTINNFSSGSGIFNNVVFSSSAGTSVPSGDIHIAKNLSITEGNFAPGSNVVYVGGNWNNSVGPEGFDETDSHIIFNGGNYHQYCSNETFNVLEVDKASGGAFRMNGTDVVCAAYDWTAGAVDVLSGSFTANDLLDNAIVGAFYNNTGGTINLSNTGTGTYVDLSGDIHNYGGTYNISGSISFWPYNHDAVLEMTDGIIDLKTCGIFINNTTHALDDNITGGLIRTSYGFSGNRSDFQPTSCYFEFYGSSDAMISQSNGCTLPNVWISKTTSKDNKLAAIPGLPGDEARIDITKGNGAKANTISLNSDVVITGFFEVLEGSLNLNGHQLDIDMNAYIHGNIIMGDPLDVFNVDNVLTWADGSTENITAGTINIGHTMQFNNGSNIQLGTGSTVNLIGVPSTTIAVESPVAEIGNLNLPLPPMTGEGSIASYSTSPLYVAGDMNMDPGNYFYVAGQELIVNGNLNVAENSIITMSSFTSDGSVECNGTLTLDGTIDVDYGSKENAGENELPKGNEGSEDPIITKAAAGGANSDLLGGAVLIHGGLAFGSTGNIYIDGGSFTCDAPYVSGVMSLSGNLELSAGLFEITDRNINFSGTTTITGGTVRAGRTFISTTSGSFQPSGGVVELTGTGSGHYLQVTYGNYFHDLQVNRQDQISIYIGTDLTIANDLIIASGVLNTNGRDIYIAGNWTNSAGPGAFLESTGRVVFNGPGHQYVYSDEEYNILEANMGAALRVPTSTVTCNEYDWTTGGVDVFTGTFTAFDLVENGLYGSFWVNPGGTINLYQDAGQWTDINCLLNFAGGGTINVYGGSDLSYWPFSADATINMNGGVLFFDGPGIHIPPPSLYTLTYNISGGIIRTTGSFQGMSGDFTPTAGTFEFTGGSDVFLEQGNGCTLHDVAINKSGGKASNTYLPGGVSPRSGIKYGPGSKTNAAFLTSDFNITNNLVVEQGTLDLDGLALSVSGDINVNSGGILSAPAFSIIRLGNLSTLSTNSGGMLEMMGSIGSESVITRIGSGDYGLNILNGGMIRAQYAIFEYMDINGVNLAAGSFVDPVFSLNHSTFRNGAPGGRLITAGMTSNVTVQDAVFPTNTWGGTFNVYKDNDEGQIVFLDASGGFDGPDWESDPFDRIFWDIPPTTFEFTVFLEGPFNTSTLLMETGLSGQLPTAQPYGPTLPYYGNTMPDWYYAGLESVGAIPGPDIIDWVLVELRDAPDAEFAVPATAVARKVGFLKNNGQIVDLDGISMLSFAVTPVNDIFAVIWHRNHLGVMSNALSFSGGSVTYDFSSGSGQAFGEGSAHKLLGGGIWGMIAGDADGSGGVGTSDLTNVWDVVAGGHGYLPADFNFDQQADNRDKNDIWLENLGTGSAIPE